LAPFASNGIFCENLRQHHFDALHGREFLDVEIQNYTTIFI
jgi:hypothetical protein